MVIILQVREDPQTCRRHQDYDLVVSLLELYPMMTTVCDKKLILEFPVSSEGSIAKEINNYLVQHFNEQSFTFQDETHFHLPFPWRLLVPRSHSHAWALVPDRSLSVNNMSLEAVTKKYTIKRLVNPDPDNTRQLVVLGRLHLLCLVGITQFTHYYPSSPTSWRSSRSTNGLLAIGTMGGESIGAP